MPLANPGEQLQKQLARTEIHLPGFHMMKQLKCYYLLLIRHYKLLLLNQFLAGYSIMATWGNNFF